VLRRAWKLRVGWALLVPLMGSCAEAPVPHAGAALVAAARADAARRFGQPPSAFTLVSAEPVTWRDGSLGCPQPGRAYTQALVPGWRIRLSGPNGELDYHARANGVPVLCPPDRAVDPLSDTGRT